MWFEKLYLRTVTKFIFFIQSVLVKFELPKNPLKKSYYAKDSDKYIKLKSQYAHSEFVNDLIKTIDKQTINFIHDLAFETQIVLKKNKIDYDHGIILYYYLRIYISNKNKNEKINIFDFGTARGFSALCMSKVLRDTASNGRIYTLDIIPNRKKIYWNTYFDKFGKRSRLNLLSKWPNLIEDIFYSR